MSAPSSRADGTEALRLRRLVQAVYVLQALSIGLALLGDGVFVTAFVVTLPATLGFALNHMRRDAARGTGLESHFTWQTRSYIRSLLALVLATLVLGPLLFLGLTLLWFFYAFVGLWLAWRVGRGVWALLKDKPLR